MSKFFLSILVFAIVVIMTKLQIPQETDRDGLIYYHVNYENGDTTYTLFSVFGMRENLHFEIADTLVHRYKRKEMPEMMSIRCSKGIVLGITQVEVCDNTTLVNFCAYQYIWLSGKKEFVEHHCNE